MKFLLLFLFAVSILFSLEQSKIDKNLVDAGHAEVYMQGMVEDGYLDDAIEFVTQANAKYKDNILLLVWSGQAYLEKDNLEMAQKLYKKALDLDPSNEIAKMKIEFIYEQESARENKNISSILEWLIDKGLDFLMIFLAFLGGEIIAKRYTTCQNNHVYTLVDYFLQNEKLYSSSKSRFMTIVSQAFTQRFFPFCVIINFFVIVTIVVAMMIVWLFIAFHFEITFLLDEPLLTISSMELDYYSAKLFTIFFVVVLTIRVFTQYVKVPKSKIICEIELVEALDTLLDNKAYRVLYEVMQDLRKEDITPLLKRYSGNTEDILKFYEKN